METNTLFHENLSKRFQKHHINNISEDCIRYDYFNAITSFIDTSDVVLEYSHPNNAKQKIDCVIKHPDSVIEAIEFKFYRPIPSKRNTPQTQLLGQLFKDFYKLKDFQESSVKTMVIVAYKNMEKYINNKFQLFSGINNNGNEVFIAKELLESQEKTFQVNIEPYSNVDLNIARTFCERLHDEYIVSILNIK